MFPGLLPRLPGSVPFYCVPFSQVAAVRRRCPSKADSDFHRIAARRKFSHRASLPLESLRKSIKGWLRPISSPVGRSFSRLCCSTPHGPRQLLVTRKPPEPAAPLFVAPIVRKRAPVKVDASSQSKNKAWHLNARSQIQSPTSHSTCNLPTSQRNTSIYQRDPSGPSR